MVGFLFVFFFFSFFFGWGGLILSQKRKISISRISLISFVNTHYSNVWRKKRIEGFLDLNSQLRGTLGGCQVFFSHMGWGLKITAAAVLLQVK